MKHSPAPFKVVRQKDGYAEFSSADNSWSRFARVVYEVEGEPDERGEANVRLFQYAPDMLRLAKYARDFMSDIKFNDKLTEHEQAIYDLAREVITNIEGDPNA